MRFRNYLKIYFCGIAMGTADIVPGISGGTMALILGFYERLIESIRQLSKLNSWLFLAPLILGILTALLTLSTVVHEILKNPDSRSWFYSLFLGLVLASVVLLTRLIRKEGTITLFIFGVLVFVGGVVAWFLTGSKSFGEEPRYKVEIQLPDNYSNYDLINYKQGFLTSLRIPEVISLRHKEILSLENPVFDEATGEKLVLKHVEGPVFNFKAMFGGMIAITAMLLPGISGSYLLNMMGLYGPAIGALADISSSISNGSLDKEALRFLFSMGVGIAFGAAIFSHAISWLLRHYHALTLSLLTGFMIGALRTVWPFWETGFKINPLRFDKGVEIEPLNPIFPNLFTIDFGVSVVALLFGFFMVLWIEKKASHKITSP